LRCITSARWRVDFWRGASIGVEWGYGESKSHKAKVK
jgi:hypothetical protein